MKLTEGLKHYEIVLLVLGVILFAVLIFVLIYSVMKKRNLAPLLFFFLVPVIMIGFPAIQKVKFDKDGIEFEKKLIAVLDQPPATTPPAATAALAAELEKYKQRAVNSPGALLKVARAETALGNIAASKIALAQAIQLDPGLKPAQDLQRRVQEFNVNTNATILREAVKDNRALSRELNR